MSGLAAVVCWESPADAWRSTVDTMLSRAPHRCRSGSLVTQVGDRALLGRGDSLVPSHRGGCDRRSGRGRPQGCWIVVDARLDNRSELIAALSRPGWSETSLDDSQLILAAYEQWGEGVAARLLGDFAFIIWDERRQRLVAARDPMTMRPLHFHHTSDRLVLASEATQLVGVPGVPIRPDEQMMAEYVSHSMHNDPLRCEYDGITRLPGGHLLVAERTGVRLCRYWHPEPDGRVRWPTRSACLEELRALATESVRTRLAPDGITAALVSGGYDSAAIVGVIEELERSSAVEPNDVALVYAFFEHGRWDETPYVERIASRVPFETYTTRARPLGLDGLRAIAAAGRRTGGARNLHLTDWVGPTLRSIGAGVALTGDGGDEVFSEGDVGLDLLERKMYLQYLREGWHNTASGVGRPRSCRSLRRAAFRLPLQIAGRRRGRRSHSGLLPDYLSKRSQEVLLDRDPLVPAQSTRMYPSTLQQRLFERVVYLIDAARGLEALAIDGLHNGFEYRAPLIDVRLIRLMLDVPFTWRIPNGKFKALMAAGLAPFIGPHVLERNSKTPRVTFFRDCLLALRTVLERELFEGSEWLSRDYVNRERARLHIQALESEGWDFDRNPAYGRRVMSAWRIVSLELWLRSLRERGRL